MDYFKEIQHCIKFILDATIVFVFTLLSLLIPEYSRSFILIISGWSCGAIIGNIISIIIYVNKLKKEK